MTNPSAVIIGGGVIGAATACFLACDERAAGTAFERDPSYRQASSALSPRSTRQQFSTPIDIALSQASLECLRHAGDERELDGQRPAIGLVEAGDAPPRAWGSARMACVMTTAAPMPAMLH